MISSINVHGIKLKKLILERIWSPSFESKDNIGQGHDASHEITQEQRNTIDRSVCFNFSMTSFILNRLKWKTNCPRLHAAIIPVQSQSHVWSVTPFISAVELHRSMISVTENLGYY